MSMFCLFTKFHIIGSSDSLFIAVKPKARENVRTVGFVLFYILQKKFP
jgi:hypothetical protein